MIVRQHQRARTQGNCVPDDLAKGQANAGGMAIRRRRNAQNPALRIEMGDAQLLISQVAEARSEQRGGVLARSQKPADRLMRVQSHFETICPPGG